MKLKRVLTVVLAVLSTYFVFQSEIVYGSELNFSVTPVQSEYQIDKNKTYFDLLLKQGQKTDLKVILANDTDKEIKVNVDIYRATTNSNGVVEYGKNNSEKDSSLQYDISDYVTYEKKVVIPAKSSLDYIFSINMPKDKFEGLIAGGITFQEEKPKDDKEGKKEQGLALKNEFSYVLGLLMRQQKDNGEPDLKLLSVKATQINARNAIDYCLQNPSFAYINSLATKADVYKEGEDKPLYSEEKKYMQAAPNSHFSLSVPLKGKKLEPGNYEIKVAAYAVLANDGNYEFGKNQEDKPELYKYHWSFTKKFKINREKAKELNETDVTIPHQDNTLIYVIIGLLILILVLLICIFLKKKGEKRND